jgi:hypothetical protein
LGEVNISSPIICYEQMEESGACWDCRSKLGVLRPFQEGTDDCLNRGARIFRLYPSLLGLEVAAMTAGKKDVHLPSGASSQGEGATHFGMTHGRLRSRQKNLGQDEGNTDTKADDCKK